ncbi:ABC transporter permease [Mesorhizobium sp. AR10]|uniref:ABC transporter permease n=1 Tax=Mesorhizobium sp. AR10 TaxID=2865839 RepID=UPI00215F8E3F|nr:ABC transporter permease [Mesorhizobium sp. AR10]UVK38804.1 ABC transporter permease [Mesorhizobium sp. AR10]
MSLAGTISTPQKWPSRQVVVSVLVLMAVLVALGVIAPNFFRYSNIINVLLQASLLGILAIGMAVVMIVGGIDLSLPANMAMSAVLGALYMRATGDWTVGPLIMIGAGAAIGTVNGFAVGRLKMIPFVVTLAMMTMVSGATVWMTNSLSISQLPETFVDVFGARPILKIPVTVLIVAGLGFVLTTLMRSSIAGRWAYAVGINEKAARVARIPIARVVVGSYVFSGLMAGLAAILVTARLGAASANMGNDGMVLDIVSACVVGGVSIYGGSGRVLGALFGALLITVLSNAMNLMGVSFYFSLVIKGAVIIAFVAADRRNGGRS